MCFPEHYRMTSRPTLLNYIILYTDLHSTEPEVPSPSFPLKDSSEAEGIRICSVEGFGISRISLSYSFDKLKEWLRVPRNLLGTHSSTLASTY